MDKIAKFSSRLIALGGGIAGTYLFFR